MQYELGSNPAASNMWGVFKDNDASADVRERVAPGFGFWSINPGSHTAASPIRFTKYGASGVFGARPQNQGTRACPIKKSLFEVVFITLFLFVCYYICSLPVRWKSFPFLGKDIKCFLGKLPQENMSGLRLI